MKKKFDDLTIAEAESLINCRDENGEHLCKKGCLFQIPPSFCHKNGFMHLLYYYCKERGLLSEDEDGELFINLESTVTEGE